MADFTELKEQLTTFNRRNRIFGEFPEEKSEPVKTEWTTRDKVEVAAPVLAGSAAMIGAAAFFNPVVAVCAIVGIPTIGWTWYCERNHHWKENSSNYLFGEVPRDAKAVTLGDESPAKPKKQAAIPSELTNAALVQEALLSYGIPCAVVAYDTLGDGVVRYELEPRQFNQDRSLSESRAMGFKASILDSLGGDFARDLGFPVGTQITIDPHIGNGLIGLIVTINKSKKEINKAVGKSNLDLANDPTVGSWVKVLIGDADHNGEAVHWWPTDTSVCPNPHMGIIGQSGRGKTQFTKALLYQVANFSAADNGGKPVGTLVFDVKDDFTNQQFLDSVGGKCYRLHKLPFNPLAIYGNKPLAPLHVAAAFASIMTQNYGLGTVQTSRMNKAVIGAYERAGISIKDAETWTRKPPTMTDLWNVFLDQNTKIDSEGNESIQEDKLYVALNDLVSFEIFEDDQEKTVGLFELIENDGVSVVSVAGDYADELKTLVVSITLNLFYNQMFTQGKPVPNGNFRPLNKLILIDEARTLLEKQFAHFSMLLEQSREFGVGLVIASQEFSHFKQGKNDYSAQIPTWVSFSVKDLDNSHVKQLFNIRDKATQEKLLDKVIELPSLHCAFIPANKRAVHVRNKPYFAWVA